MQASLTINMHAHISLGKWEVNPDAPKLWCSRIARARRRLASANYLDMELMLNPNLEHDDKRVVFTIEVHSIGGHTLNSLKQILGSSGLKCVEDRCISPPGLVFHVSVYDNDKYFSPPSM